MQLKKFISIMICIAIVFSLFAITVNAQIMPIKKIGDYFYGGVVLRENGDLLVSNSETNELPTIILSDVKDFNIAAWYGSDILCILFNDNKYIYLKWYDITEGVLKNNKKIEDYYKPVDTDVREFVSKEHYIKTNGDLIWFDSNNKKLILKDVKTVIFDDGFKNSGMAIKANGEAWAWANEHFEPEMIIFDIQHIAICDLLTIHVFGIDKDGALWYWIGGEYKEYYIAPIKIMNDVADIYSSGGDYLWVLKKNGDVYGWGDMRDNKKFYDNKPILIAKDIKSIKGYLIYNNNKLYNKSNNFIVTSNVKEFDGISLTLTLDNELYDGKTKMADDVQGFFRFENNVFIKKTNGELWGYGKNSYGGLGIGKVRDVKTPVPLLYSTKSTKVLFNGTAIKLSQKIQNKDNRTFYPFRECLEAMGAKVFWDNEAKTAIGQLNGNKIEFQIGKNEYKVNGVIKSMDTVAYIDESVGRTYIPLRFAAEGLGFKVNWQPGEHEDTVTITK